MVLRYTVRTEKTSPLHVKGPLALTFAVGASACVDDKSVLLVCITAIGKWFWVG